MTETIWTPDRVAERRHDKWRRAKLSTPEGRMQDCLERTLPQNIVADAQKREMWDVHPDVAASGTTPTVSRGALADVSTSAGRMPRRS